MQTCSHCGAELPANSRFCGKCGSVQHAIAPDTRSTTPQPPSWTPEGSTLPATWPPYSNYSAQGSAPAWPPNVQAPGTPPPATENEDERRRGIPPWSPLSGAGLGADALLGSGQASTPGAPLVQGTPQIGSVPSVAGSPTPYTNAPIGHPARGPLNSPVGHPAQGPANAPIGHPAHGPLNSPVGHPANAPYPQAGPQPTHYPPERPGMREQHPPHERQGHRAYHTQPTAAGVTKVAGGLAVK